MRRERAVDLSVVLPEHIADELEALRRESPESLQRVLTEATLRHRSMEVLSRSMRSDAGSGILDRGARGS